MTLTQPTAVNLTEITLHTQVQFQDRTQLNAIAEEEVARRALARARLISNQVPCLSTVPTLIEAPPESCQPPMPKICQCMAHFLNSLPQVSLPGCYADSQVGKQSAWMLFGALSDTRHLQRQQCQLHNWEAQ